MNDALHHLYRRSVTDRANPAIDAPILAAAHAQARRRRWRRRWPLAAVAALVVAAISGSTLNHDTSDPVREHFVLVSRPYLLDLRLDVPADAAVESMDDTPAQEE